MAYPDKSDFEPFLKGGKVRRCQCWKTDRSAQCAGRAVHGKQVCRVHGGAKGSGRPILHGRFAESLPVRLLLSYRDALNDPDLASTREYLAIYEALIHERLKGMGETSPQELWAAALGFLDGYEKGNDEQGLIKLREVLENGAGAARKEDELRQLMGEARKQAETENRRVASAENNLTKREALTMIAALLDSVRRHVQEPRVFALLAADIESIFGSEAGGGAQGGRAKEAG